MERAREEGGEEEEEKGELGGEKGFGEPQRLLVQTEG
jgi:hypothetical protein